MTSLEIRARRKLLRGRAYLVRLRTSVKNRIHGHLTAENCRTEVTDLYGKAGRAWLATGKLSEMGRVQIDLLLEVVEQLDLRIKRLDRRVQQLAKKAPVGEQYQRLLRAKGKAKAAVAAARKLSCYLYWSHRHRTQPMPLPVATVELWKPRSL